MLFLGKYAIYIVFEDGDEGYFMEIMHEGRDIVGLSSSFEAANKYLSESSAEKDYWNKIHGNRSVYGSKIVKADIVKDGRSLMSRLFND